MAAASGLAYAGARMAQAVGLAMAAAVMDVVALAWGDGVGVATGLCVAFLLVGLLALAAVPLCWRWPANMGDGLTGRGVPHDGVRQAAP